VETEAGRFGSGDRDSVLAILARITGDPERALHWFRRVPLTELGGETAEHYVAAGRASAVVLYVTNLSAGGTG